MDPKKREELVAKLLADESRLFDGTITALMFLANVSVLQAEINDTKRQLGLEVDVRYPKDLSTWASNQLDKKLPGSNIQ